MTKLTITELAAEAVELLPCRETLTTFLDLDLNMTTVNAFNGAVALNGGGAGSHATAVAGQSICVWNANG